MLLVLKTSHFQGDSPVPLHLISLVCIPNLAVWLLGSHLNLFIRWRKCFQIWRLAVGTLVLCTQDWVFYKGRNFFGSPLAERFRRSITCTLARSSSVVPWHGREAEKKAAMNRRHQGVGWPVFLVSFLWWELFFFLWAEIILCILVYVMFLRQGLTLFPWIICNSLCRLSGLKTTEISLPLCPWMLGLIHALVCPISNSLYKKNLNHRSGAWRLQIISQQVPPLKVSLTLTSLGWEQNFQAMHTRRTSQTQMISSKYWMKLIWIGLVNERFWVMT